VKTRFLLAVAATGLALSTDALAFKVFEDQDKGIVVNVGVLLQPWAQYTKPKVGPPGAQWANGQGSALVGAPSTEEEGNGTGGSQAVNPSMDFFLRRARFIVSGTALKDIGFFFSVDQPDYGIGGSFGGLERNKRPFFIQDAFLTYQFAPEFKIDAGMMSVPMARHTIESAATLNALDFHSSVVRFPTGKNYHDTGVEVRGTVNFGAPVDLNYRLGLFEGVRNLGAEETPVEPVGATYPKLNDGGDPRVTGQLRLTHGSGESDFFLKGIYFSPTPIFSVGVGVDYQPKAVLKLAIPSPDPMDPSLGVGPQPGTYLTLSADAFVEYPFSADDEVLFKVNAFQYSEGWSRIQDSNMLEQGGVAGFAELGFRHAWIEPIVGIDYLKAKASDVAPITQRDSQILAYHGGVNFWINQHTFNVKLDVTTRQIQKEGRVSSTQTDQSLEKFTHQDMLATVQGQVFF
jgi:hypothetical protein